MSPREARGPAPAENRNTGEARSNLARPFTPPVKNNEAARENNTRPENARPQSEARPQPRSEAKPQAKPAAKPKPAPRKEEKEKK
jgi:hypothetical protein